MFSKLLRQKSLFLRHHLASIGNKSSVLVRASSGRSLFGAYEPKQDSAPTFLVFPEIPSDTVENNEFLQIPTTGEIQFDALNVEKLVKACGKQSIEFEHFIEEYSETLRQEFEGQDVSNEKLTEFISEMERHLLPLHYTLNLLHAFRVIRKEEFNFEVFDQFFMQRLAKSKLRYKNRNIYYFMCEMKARRQMYATTKKDGKTPLATPKTEIKLKDQTAFQQVQKDQLVDRYVREAKLLGLGLKHQDQMTVYALINEKLSQEQQKYVSTAAQANSMFHSNIISPQFLDCLPDHVITQLNHHDTDAVFNSFLRYCPDQTLRKDFWLQYNARAAPFFGSKLNNILAIEKIREHRHRKAQLLDYENFAQMSLDLRGTSGGTMAGSVENVRAFINGLSVRTENRFEKNLQEIKDFALDVTRQSQPTGKDRHLAMMPSNALVNEQLNLWDLKYFERLYLRDKYEINSRDVRAYFPLDRVVSGMLQFAESLFGIKIVEIKDEKNVWGGNVQHFKVFDATGRSSAEYGSFYFDPFQRETRIVQPIARSDALHTKPVVFFLMNFTPASGSIGDQYDTQLLRTGKELLNFSQVVQLFGKFGFVLQQLLTEVTCSEISSLANIEADAFHIVSHFMQMWPLNSYRVLANCSSHIKTGEPISEEFFERIRQSYYHFVSFGLKHELYLMSLDLNLHSTREHSSALQKQTWKEWMSPFESLEEDGHICSLVDIFKGNGLEGIYYSGKWSEVIAADIFDAFREAGLSNTPDTLRPLGERFKDTFLAQSGVVETNELFRRFQGRDPTLNGYLSISGFE